VEMLLSPLFQTLLSLHVAEPAIAAAAMSGLSNAATATESPTAAVVGSATSATAGSKIAAANE
jgi:hypothetical protein